jgi:hypothetical protein
VRTRRRYARLVEHCTNCGAPRQRDANFCGSCGHRFDEEPATGTSASAVSVADSPTDDTPYGGEMTLVAVLVSAVAPFIALIVALVMRASEVRPRRRSFLKGWAIASAAWLCTGWIVVLFLFAGISSSASGCKGGIDRFSVPSFESSDNVHWTATYACVNGGTKKVPYHGKVP